MRKVNAMVVIATAFVLAAPCIALADKKKVNTPKEAGCRAAFIQIGDASTRGHGGRERGVARARAIVGREDGQRARHSAAQRLCRCDRQPARPVELLSGMTKPLTEATYRCGMPMSRPTLAANDCWPFLGLIVQVGSTNQPRSLVGQNMKSRESAALTVVD